MKISDREKIYWVFKTKYLWKSVDFDKAYGPQCVDLAKQYAKEVYWVILGSFGWSAYKWFLNGSKTFDTTKWKKVEYGPGIIPIAGDIIFWKPTSSNSYWHVAIAGVWSTVDKLVLLEQNYVAESSKDFWKWTWAAAITQRTRDYKNFAGSYRFI